ncbi:pyridoxamine 5'-phosphate oxidase [Mycobacterium intermedium]|uniref:Pyridoxamine 5'-phosphate oxidase n=1 Tax=Mycobacterium intermedium TaxID=28445 RepID=A0A1E3SGV8_MYCIE|nr:pyridoxamine 5'-phosphate oxidase family protein [Mycobacterium intermedium]MCV6964562.1 pyridoxamine 5'-phosphate oxidase family protein [Mycobacterium intermedium]ODR01370.1 pyridoxamine 5'-phosphate oxidase [Mycobacterium intermedium]OPE52532.1 pyridoxamine 5'-phosphate oxidase [Mycobacterium intermedium]ORB07480.1 pyridoxamine 5'-phosphate oxidase [Mycobacterium intermedium]
MTITECNLDGYGAPTIEWARVESVLASQLPQAPGTGGPQRHTMWLSTINPDGRPHVVPVGVIVSGSRWYFTSGPATRKSRNLTRDARCVISVATEPFDLVLEGQADRVTDSDELRTAAEAFAADGWPARVEGDALTAGYSAPSAGPPPWYLYRLTVSTVFAFGTSEPLGATKFQLD